MDLALIHELEQFIYAESALLDERRFEDWLRLLTEDVTYFVPNATPDGTVGECGAVVREDLLGLQARVARILHRQNPTQKPAARTRHFVTNIVVGRQENESARLSANLVLYVAKDDVLRSYPGTMEYELRRIAGHWRIGHKKIFLITNDAALGQLPLI